MAAGCARAAIQEVGSGLECIRPERGWHGSVEKRGAHTIIQCAENAVGTAVLLRCVGAGEAQHDPTRSQEGAKHLVVELTAIVGLEGENRASELCLDEGMEREQRGQDVGLASQREHPRKM